MSVFQISKRTTTKSRGGMRQRRRSKTTIALQTSTGFFWDFKDTLQKPVFHIHETSKGETVAKIFFYLWKAQLALGKTNLQKKTAKLFSHFFPSSRSIWVQLCKTLFERVGKDTLGNKLPSLQFLHTKVCKKFGSLPGIIPGCLSLCTRRSFTFAFGKCQKLIYK